jgi:hypothetical protein
MGNDGQKLGGSRLPKRKLLTARAGCRAGPIMPASEVTIKPIGDHIVLGSLRLVRLRSPLSHRRATPMRAQAGSAHRCDVLPQVGRR